MPKIGAHVSAAVSLDLSFERAQHIGAECTQIFISPPQQWLQAKHNEKEIEKYKQKQKETGIGPNFIHGTYLINLGTQNSELLQKSIDWLVYALNLADKLEVQGVIFHLGSHKGVGFDGILDQVVKSLEQILKQAFGSEAQARRVQDDISETTPFLILETAAGAGNVIGDKFSELGQILNQVNDPRLKVCLDSQHVFAAGYDIRSASGLDKTLQEFDQQIGLDNLVVIHANDSKVEVGSNKDRHENIGEGFIGRDGFSNLITNQKLKDILFILEVPGFTNAGPDLENIKFLKSLRNS